MSLVSAHQPPARYINGFISLVGMGKLVDLVKEHVPHGETIACSIATTNLIVTGVSNWGGYALATALSILEKEVCTRIPSPSTSVIILTLFLIL